MLRLPALIILLAIASPTPLLAQQQAAPSTSQSAVKAKDTTVRWVTLEPDKAGLLHAIQAHVTKALAEGRTAFLELGATWCGPCKELEASLQHKDMIDAFAGSYIIHIDIDQWGLTNNADRLSQVADTALGHMKMPVIMAINKKGRIIGVLPRGIKADEVKQFLQAHLWTAPAQSDSSGARPAGQ